MNLAAYLKKHELSQQQFADQIGVSQGAVSHWIVGRVQISIEKAREIEKKTKGAVRLEDLRPDIFQRVAA